MPTDTPQDAASLAHRHVLVRGDTVGAGLPPMLERSWQRSLAAGLRPDQISYTDHHSSTQALQDTLESNQRLLAHARPAMEFLFEQVRHNQNVEVLADQQGTLLHTLGDPVFLDRTQRVALSRGASWREEHRGTNAIGTALAEFTGVEVHGAEHFLQRNTFLTCAAAPILSYDGSLLGVLDVSGDARDGHPHTLALVNTAARMIENQLLQADCKKLVRVHLHGQPEGIGSMAQGIVVVTEAGTVVGANRSAMDLLQLQARQLGRMHWSDLSDARLQDLLPQTQRSAPVAAAIRLHSGRMLFARVQAPERVRPGGTSPVARVLPQHDALAELDTGDGQWRRAAEQVRRVLDKPIPILIEGESGTGKEYFARAIHDSSKRRAGPFVAINCASIPENLIEAELFGYASGAYTGARKEGSPGLLRKADGGTLFLDEIGDMPIAMQTRLLRVLQERRVAPLGGGAEVAVDFALVCATHSQLRSASGTGQFRGDLFYRINGLTLRLPALRERSDLEALAQRMLADINPGRSVGLAGPVLQAMTAFDWPGNLRQFASVLRTASAMLGPDEFCIGWEHLPDDVAADLARGPAAPAQHAPTVGTPQNLAELSRLMVQQALQQSGGNVSQAARVLGISRQTLYKKMRQT